MFLNNYTASCNQTLYAWMTLSGGIIAKRHWEASKLDSNSNLNRLCHRFIAIVEVIPLIGIVATLIEVVAKRCLYQDESPPDQALSTPIQPITIDFPDRKCAFHGSFESVGFFSVTNPSKSKTLKLELRKIGSSPNHEQIVIYAPFIKSDSRLFNQGWLALEIDQTKKCVLVNRLDNFCFDFSTGVCRRDRKYPGVGAALIQFAIEKSIEVGFEGRIQLTSTNGSGLFYLKMGFKSWDPKVQARLEEASQLNSSESIDGGKMFLPDDALGSWKEKIDLSPITRSSTIFGCVCV